VPSFQVARLEEKCHQTYLGVDVQDMISSDIEGISSKSVTESRKLMAVTTLARLLTKQDQIAELDTIIAEKIPMEHMAHEHCNSKWSIDDVMTSIFKKIQTFEMSQQCMGKSINQDIIMPTTDHPCTNNHTAVMCFVRVTTNPLSVVDPEEGLAIV